MEIWKDIDGFEGKYQVSSWGRVRNKSGIIVHATLNKKGYLRVWLYKKGKYLKPRVHRLVATAFIPNPYNLPQVNHKDGNKQNNSYTNLEWVTNRQNQEHAKNMRKLAYGK